MKKMSRFTDLFQEKGPTSVQEYSAQEPAKPQQDVPKQNEVVKVYATPTPTVTKESLK
jgi:hypothetical protein